MFRTVSAHEDLSARVDRAVGGHGHGEMAGSVGFVRVERPSRSESGAHGGRGLSGRGAASSGLVRAWLVGCAPDSPSAANVFFSLHDSTRVHTFPHPLLYSADFYRKLLDDLSGPALSPLGFSLALLGLLTPAARRYRVWLVTCGLLVVLLPLKFYKLNYYDLVILPPLALLAGLGWRQLQTTIEPSRRAVAVIVAVGFVLSMRYAFFPAFITPDEDRAVLPAAAALRRLAPPQEPIVAIHGSNFDLLYYCDHPGWAVPVDDSQFAAHVADAARQGAHWLVIANLVSLDGQPAAKSCLAQLPIATEGDDFRVYRLGP